MNGSVDSGFLDASMIRVTNSWFTGDIGGEIFNASFAGKTVKVNGVAPTLSFIWVGDVTCLSANINAANGPNFCGVIGNAMDPGKRGLVRVNGFDGCHGDSGGGWYWLTNSGPPLGLRHAQPLRRRLPRRRGRQPLLVQRAPAREGLHVADAERRDPTVSPNSCHRPSASNSCGRPSRSATAEQS